jgi:hypothetical protein
MEATCGVLARMAQQYQKLDVAGVRAGHQRGAGCA